MVERNRSFGLELFDTAVGVDVDDVKGIASPVLGDVRVWKLIASACAFALANCENIQHFTTTHQWRSAHRSSP